MPRSSTPPSSRRARSPICSSSTSACRTSSARRSRTPCVSGRSTATSRSLFVTAIDDEEANRLEAIAPVVRKPFDFADFVEAVQTGPGAGRGDWLRRSAGTRDPNAGHRGGSRYALAHRDGGAPGTDDPHHAVPRADQRAERDRPVAALVRARGRDALPGVGQVRVLRGPEQRRHLRHLAAVQVPHRGARRRAVPVRACWRATSAVARRGMPTTRPGSTSAGSSWKTGSSSTADPTSSC